MISTKKINLDSSDAGGSFTKSMIEPGFYKKLRIISAAHKIDHKFGDRITFLVETDPINEPNFKGINKIKGVPESGSYTGRIGYIGYSRWGFTDFTTTLGLELTKEDQLAKAIGVTCRNLGLTSWWENRKETYNNASELVEEFIKEQPFKDVWFSACIGGRAYLSKDGKHTNYEMFFPREDRTLGRPFDIKEAKVQAFFEHTHIEPLKVKTENSVLPVETSKEPIEESTNQSAADFLAEINAPVEQTFHKQTESTQPVRPTPSSKAEEDFMNAGKKIENPFTESILNGGPEESVSDIVTDNNSNILPWEV